MQYTCKHDQDDSIESLINYYKACLPESDNKTCQMTSKTNLNDKLLKFLSQMPF